MADPSTNTEMVRVPILGENGRISDDYVPQEIPDSVATVTQKAAEAAQSASNASASASAASQSAEAAATSETNAADSAQDASDAVTDATNQATAAKGHSDTAKSYSDSASQSALAASGYVTNASQSASDAATSAAAAAESASAASGSASNAATSESNAASSAANAAGSATAASGYATSASNSATAAAGSASGALESKNQAQQILDEADAKFIEGATATTLAPSASATATVVDNILQLGIPKGDTGLGIPEGGSAGQVVKRTVDGTEWAYDTGAVYNSEDGLQEMAEDGTNDPIYNFGITQGGMSASMSVMRDSPEVAVDYSKSSVSYRNAIGADADGPYVDLNLSGETGGATKYRYIDDVDSMLTTDGIPTAKAAYAAAKGNTLSGTKTGVVVTASDAYAAKPLEICIKGATRQNLWVNPSGTRNGVTVTSNDDGSLTVAGTNTAQSDVYIGVRCYALRNGATYTASIDKKPVGFNLSADYYNEDGYTGTVFSFTPSNATEVKTTTDFGEATWVSFFVVVEPGVTASGTYRIMLNEGSTAEPWCPPGLNSVDELSVVTAGKNLIPISTPQTSEEFSKGLSATVNDDGSYHITGTSTDTYARPIQYTNVWLSKGTYTLSGRLTSTNSKGYLYVQIKKVGATGYTTAATGPSVVSVDEPGVYNVSFTVPTQGATFNGDLHPQLELGSIATAYEPPNVTTTPIDLDGHTLNSLPDGTHDELIIEADGSASIVKRVHEQEFTANDFNINTINNSQAPLSADTSLGVSFLPSQQMNDFAPVANADSVNYLVAGVFNSAGFQRFRVGKIGMGTDSKDCLAKVKSTIGSATIKALYPLAAPETIPLTSVTLPTLPSPNITVYNDSDVPSDMTLEYERDVTIAFEQLEAKISELTVNQAIS